jgi:hypothetical protein
VDALIGIGNVLLVEKEYTIAKHMFESVLKVNANHTLSKDKIQQIETIIKSENERKEKLMIKQIENERNKKNLKRKTFLKQTLNNILSSTGSSNNNNNNNNNNSNNSNNNNNNDIIKTKNKDKKRKKKK